MIFHINFFKRTISQQEWRSFFKALYKECWVPIKLRVSYENGLLRFVLESAKDLSSLNSKLFPFYLVPRQGVLSPAAPVQGIGMAYGNFVEILMKEQVKNRKEDLSSFEINLWKFKLPFPRLMRLAFKSGNEFSGSYYLLFSRLEKFLAFDLSRAIDINIEKVKPELKAADLNRLQRSNAGVLCLPNDPSFMIPVDSFDFWKHSLVVGQSGSGKSKLIEIFLRDLYASAYRDEYCVLLLDPHGTLQNSLQDIPETKVLDFHESTVNLFTNSANPLSSTELTMKVLEPVVYGEKNQQMQRVLKYALFALYKTKQMNLENLKKLLTDVLFRKSVVKTLEEVNVQQFFDNEFMELYNRFQNEAILPILNVISEFSFLNFETKAAALEDVMNRHFLTIASIPQIELGATSTRLVGGSLIQQAFSCAQVGAFKKKVIVMVDEVSVVQNPSLGHVLSEARKFNLGMFLVQQYLQQVSVDILQSIFSNAINYFCFKLSREDAELMGKNLNLEINEIFLRPEFHHREIDEFGLKVLSDLNVGECVVRLMKDSKYILPFRANTVLS